MRNLSLERLRRTVRSTRLGVARAGRAAAFALLAAALGPADAARAETHESGISTPGPADPFAWGNPAEAARADKTAPPGAVSLDAVRRASAAKDSSRMGFAGALACVAGFALLASLFSVLRRRRRRELRLRTLFEVTETPDAPPPPGEVQAPRFLPSNPYVDPQGPRRLGRQIENAAEASLEFGRVLGVIFFDLGDPPADPTGGSARAWNENSTRLVFNLRTFLRPTDHVALLANRYIVVCIALLPGMTELVGISERVRGLGQSSPSFAAAFARRPGLAIFPLCGYRGDELIAHARANFHALNARLSGRLPSKAGELEPASDGNG